MGTFLVNLHVRIDDHDALVRELRAMPIGGGWVIPAKHGWATVYEERMSSQPDYFESGASGNVDQARWQGRPNVLLRFCVRGTAAQDVERVLRQAPMNEDEAGQDADTDGGAGLQPENGMGPDIAQFLGFSQGADPPDPLVADLVQAASDGKLAEIDKLVAAGVKLAGTAPLKMSPQRPQSLTSQMLAGGPMSIPVSPLHAAIAAKQIPATQRLIELGADVNDKHPLFGSPIHAAVTGGAPDLLQMLLDAGAGANEVSLQRQTPLEMLRALRQMMSQLDNFQSLGAAMPDKFVSRLDVLMPTEGWDECERLLIKHGGR